MTISAEIMCLSSVHYLIFIPLLFPVYFFTLCLSGSKLKTIFGLRILEACKKNIVIGSANRNDDRKENVDTFSQEASAPNAGLL